MKQDKVKESKSNGNSYFILFFLVATILNRVARESLSDSEKQSLKKHQRKSKETWWVQWTEEGQCE